RQGGDLRAAGAKDLRLVTELLHAARNLQRIVRQAELQQQIGVGSFRFLHEAGEIGRVRRILLVDDNGHAGGLGEIERAALAVEAVAYKQGKWILRGEDRHARRPLVRRQGLDQLEDS